MAGVLTRYGSWTLNNQFFLFFLDPELIFFLVLLFVFFFLTSGILTVKSSKWNRQKEQGESYGSGTGVGGGRGWPGKDNITACHKHAPEVSVGPHTCLSLWSHIYQIDALVRYLCARGALVQKSRRLTAKCATGFFAAAMWCMPQERMCSV